MSKKKKLLIKSLRAELALYREALGSIQETAEEHLQAFFSEFSPDIRNYYVMRLSGIISTLGLGAKTALEDGAYTFLGIETNGGEDADLFNDIEEIREAMKPKEEFKVYSCRDCSEEVEVKEATCPKCTQLAREGFLEDTTEVIREQAHKIKTLEEAQAQFKAEGSRITRDVMRKILGEVEQIEKGADASINASMNRQSWNFSRNENIKDASKLRDALRDARVKAMRLSGHIEAIINPLPRYVTADPGEEVKSNNPGEEINRLKEIVDKATQKLAEDFAIPPSFFEIPVRESPFMPTGFGLIMGGSGMQVIKFREKALSREAERLALLEEESKRQARINKSVLEILNKAVITGLNADTDKLNSLLNSDKE